MVVMNRNKVLPEIPGKRQFTIGEVAELCAVKPHVLRYWEQEFHQLQSVGRKSNRRSYQRDDVLLVRQIRSLLYEQGFTIEGARAKLQILNAANESQLDVQVDSATIKQMIIELHEVLLLLEL